LQDLCIVSLLAGTGLRSHEIAQLRVKDINCDEHYLMAAVDVPIQHIQRARQPCAGPVKTLEIHEVKRILAGIDTSTVLGYRDFALFNLLYALGLRLSEALSLDLDSIDWQKGTCTVQGKGRKQRTLYLVKPLRDILPRYRQLRTELRNAQRSNAFFLSKKGNRL
jgi:site-specific recombinase XerD